MFAFSVNLVIMWKKDIIRGVTARKVTAHLCLQLIVNEVKISVEQGMVVTTLNIYIYTYLCNCTQNNVPLKCEFMT